MRFGLKLSVGSLVGAVFGVCLNMLIPESGVKTLLYTVVFLSGISILLRKIKRQLPVMNRQRTVHLQEIFPLF